MEMMVYVVTEHEPDCDFPVIVKEVFASEDVADAFITKLVVARDKKGEQTSKDLWWDVCSKELLEKMPKQAWVGGGSIIELGY